MEGTLLENKNKLNGLDNDIINITHQHQQVNKEFEEEKDKTKKSNILCHYRHINWASERN